MPDYTKSSFRELQVAPAAAVLYPVFCGADLGVGQVNELIFDPSALAWLQEQVDSRAGAVIARLTGPGGGQSLFAWDSGVGPATAGEAPQLVLDLRPAPAAPRPLPTEAVVVATETPTPANVLTAAVEAWTATASARTNGTPTPAAFRYVTPTPSPANLATAQAPQNVLTVAARFLAEMARSPTPWPYNAVVATVPVYVVITHTPTPAGAATAAYHSAYATAAAIVYGIPTPFPPTWLTATPVPQPVVTPTPEPAVFDCPDSRARLDLPAPGSAIRGEVALTGTAAAEGSSGYALEYAPGTLATEGYQLVFRSAAAVENGELARLNTTALPNGIYTLRLTITIGSTPASACRIVVEIRNP